MTAADWLETNDPQKMLEFLRGKVSQRKLRLFAVACCRRIWHFPLELMDDSEGATWITAIRGAVDVGERLAEGRATRREVEAARHLDGCGIEVLYAFLGCAGKRDELPDVSENVLQAVPEFNLAGVPALGKSALGKSDSETPCEAERRAHAHLLRCIFGSPEGGVRFNHGWATQAVLSLAQTAYETRSLPSGTFDQDRLAVLSDALEEAGCDDADILAHLRPGPHVRGCWPVDLILGRK